MRSFKMLDLERINSLANKLKKQRQKMNLSLDQAHKQTRIHLNILKAFEEGDFSILSPTYIKSFLKRYSEFLGLSPKEILDEYTAIYPQDAKQVIFLEKEKQAKKILPKKITKVIKYVGIPAISIIVIIFLTYTAIQFFGSIHSKLRQSHKKVVAVSKRTKQREAAETEKLIIPRNKPIILTLMATGDSWLQVKIDGNTIFKGLLKKGAKETWQAADEIELLAGKPECLFVELNQKAFGKLVSGSANVFVITREGIRPKK